MSEWDMPTREGYAMAYRAIAELHPDHKVPEWFLARATSTARKISENSWRFHFYGFSKLGPEYEWKHHDGGKTLLHTDPDTGKKVVVISGPSGLDRLIYDVEVDMASRKAWVIKAFDPAALNIDELEVINVVHEEAQKCFERLLLGDSG